MRRQKQPQKIKDGGIFYRDIAEMHNRARYALLKVKKIEEHRQTIPVRIDHRTVLLVDAGKDVNLAASKFKHQLITHANQQ
jgi:hypothetical protein